MLEGELSDKNLGRLQAAMETTWYMPEGSVGKGRIADMARRLLARGILLVKRKKVQRTGKVHIVAISVIEQDEQIESPWTVLSGRNVLVGI